MNHHFPLIFYWLQKMNALYRWQGTLFQFTHGGYPKAAIHYPYWIRYVQCIGLTHGAVVTQPLGQRLVDARVRAPAAGEGGEQRQQAGGHGTGPGPRLYLHFPTSQQLNSQTKEQ